MARLRLALSLRLADLGPLVGGERIDDVRVVCNHRIMLTMVAELVEMLLVQVLMLLLLIVLT